MAEALVEGALDPLALSGLDLGRVGAWPTHGVTLKTTVALLRLRFKLTVHGRRERLLLAEEAALVAVVGGKIVATGEAVRIMLATTAAHDLAQVARDRFIRAFIRAAHDDLPQLITGPLADHARTRAVGLAEDHARLRAAAGIASRVSVDPALPPGVIGLFVLLPAQG